MYCKEPAITITFALSNSITRPLTMKVLLKFTILCAWLLFVAALWQIHRAPASQVAGRSLPTSGLLSISRKMTDSQAAAQPLSDPQPMHWPTRDLQLTLPAIGF